MRTQVDLVLVRPHRIDVQQQPSSSRELLSQSIDPAWQSFDTFLQAPGPLWQPFDFPPQVLEFLQAAQAAVERSASDVAVGVVPEHH